MQEGFALIWRNAARYDARLGSARGWLYSIIRYRALNMLRGKYLTDLGNTPGHVQHWSAHGLTRLVERELRVLDRRQPLPWTVLLARV